MLIMTIILISSFSNLKDDEGVPPDYGSKETTLIILKLTQMNRVNEKIKDVFTDNYKGKFVMVDTVDEKWVKEALEDFDQTKIVWKNYNIPV